MDPGSAGGQSGQRDQPRYDTNNGGHYGASAALAAQGHAPAGELYAGTWANVTQGLQGNYRDILMTYWQHTISHLENEPHDFKLHQLPLARIKKVMKADPEVKMISAEAPILFAKGCDIFITELTMRAWIHAEENKRRTLQRSDIASALSKSDMFDFLIDIVPREEANSQKRTGTQSSGNTAAAAAAPAPLPQQHAAPQPQAHPHPATQPQHPMAPSEYAIAQHAMSQEQEYRPPQSLYAPQVQPDHNSAYQQQPQYLNDMYSFQQMAPPQMYQLNQRAAQEGPRGHPASAYHQRHDGGGEGEADAEGDRDFDV